MAAPRSTASKLAASTEASAPAAAPAAAAASASAAVVGEDDEFEDFPMDDWPDDTTEAAAGRNGTATTKHLWEESWDDDDTTDEFSVQLREELQKVEAAKKR